MSEHPSHIAEPDTPDATNDATEVGPPLAPHEQLLLSRLLEGDEAAFTELVDAHYSAMKRLARVFVSSEATAEEVVQETWVAVLDGLRRFEGRSSLKTWIFRILVNRAKTRAVREARSVPFSALEKEGDDEPAVDPSRFNEKGMWAAPPARWEDNTPEKMLQRKEAMECLAKAVAALPARQRVIVTLRDIEGWTAEEACNVLGLAETNQRVLLHRARSRLRSALELKEGKR